MDLGPFTSRVLRRSVVRNWANGNEIQEPDDLLNDLLEGRMESFNVFRRAVANREPPPQLGRSGHHLVWVTPSEDLQKLRDAGATGLELLGALGLNWGGALFSVDSLKDPAGLATKLRDAGDPLSQYLRGQLSQETQRQLEEYASASLPSQSLQDALVSELNLLLEGPLLFEQGRFAQVNLTAETRSLVAQQPQGEYVIRLNRLLLEEAYPDQINWVEEDAIEIQYPASAAGRLIKPSALHALTNPLFMLTPVSSEFGVTARGLREAVHLPLAVANAMNKGARFRLWGIL